MGPLGWQETVFIFVLALLIFGPKKLPELGKNLAKGLAEFRRASNELKSTFDREMKTLERENESLKEVTQSYYPDSYNYDYSSYDSGHYGSAPHDSTANAVNSASASAPQGAESTPGTAPEGTVANGDLNGSAVPENPAGTATHAGGSSHPDAAPPTTEHQTLKS
jgi:TatA/E family protein of Tat protein translocase